MSKRKGSTPMRMCSVCGVRADKVSLTRLVTVDGVVVVDITGKISGRGAYLCVDEDAGSIGRAHAEIARALRIDVEAVDRESVDISLDLNK